MHLSHWLKRTLAASVLASVLAGGAAAAQDGVLLALNDCDKIKDPVRQRECWLHPGGTTYVKPEDGGMHDEPVRHEVAKKPSLMDRLKNGLLTILPDGLFKKERGT